MRPTTASARPAGGPAPEAPPHSPAPLAALRALRAHPVPLGLDGVSGKATSLLLDVLTEGALLMIYGYLTSPLLEGRGCLRLAP
ncbi:MULTISPECIES: hypothetical protein [Streptomyces]|uniref:Uncharacterized protein n=1 Tax=Streptomyces mirabilis TaxID=68239 RepID=A0ABU3V368_9ACTN|nr:MULTISPECIES: hypothetical protein [Streptomyces]MCX4615354.1 hypothetical protein [Streptomyces mirabilis]MCX5356684.1 hypothetical protein [Streptomyces mirabilis]MCZ0997782.1 hypothetical protein [Streptomyces mirabilis]MDU9000630.1 hypothetical protein [Streptomyces mirabilis]